MPPPTCELQAKSAFGGIFDPTSLQFDLTPKFQNCIHLCPSLLVVEVWSNSINKCPRYRANNVYSGLADARINSLETPPATTLAEA